MVNAARSGDREALTTLIRAVWPAAYRIAWSVIADRAVAEDAAQEACTRALSAIDTLRRPESFAPWFYRIVVNEAKQRLRARARELPIPTAMRDGREAAHAGAGAVDDRIDVRRAIDALKPALRVTVVLHYYFEMSSAEIASIVGTSPVTTRWRLMVAHRKLRTLLQPGREIAGKPTPQAEELCV